MKLGWICLVLSLAIAGCSAGSKPSVKTSAYLIAPMDGHKTYAYDASAPPTPGSEGVGSQDQIAQIKERVDAAMQAKGYTLSPKPHLMVRISLGHKTVRDPTAVRGAGAETVHQQEMYIDVFDFGAGTHLFHGTASSILGKTPPAESPIAESVPSILERVPPASGQSG